MREDRKRGRLNLLIFKDRKLFGAQFGELENVYKITQEKHISTKI